MDLVNQFWIFDFNRKSEMQLGILGGTFDPIHLGHLLMAEMAWDSLGLTRVLFVPAGDPPHKQAVEKTPARHRQAMVERAIRANPHFELCPVDLERPGPHYAIDTVRLIRARYNLEAENCFFIIGADSLKELPTWHQAPQLITLCRLAVVHRFGYLPELTALTAAIPGLSARLDWVAMPLIGVAASEIRARVQAGQSIRYQVVDAVADYIQQNKLYR
jgi:nicotinate-nucleotide adenylyltransferase